MKFTNEDLKDLKEHEILLVINFSLFCNYTNTEANTVFNCYIEGTDLLSIAERKLQLSSQDIDFLYHFFLENDHY